MGLVKCFRMRTNKARLRALRLHSYENGRLKNDFVLTDKKRYKKIYLGIRAATPERQEYMYAMKMLCIQGCEILKPIVSIRHVSTDYNCLQEVCKNVWKLKAALG